MNKSICFLSAFILLLSCGCRGKPAEPVGGAIGVSLEDFQKQDIVVPDINEGNKDNRVVFEGLSEESDCIDIMDMVDSRYWGVKSEKNESQELDSKELLLEVNPYNEISLQYPDHFPQWQVGSGRYVIMQNQYIYEWKSYTAGFGDQQLHDMKLTRLDVKTGEVTVAAEMQLNTPLIYLCPLDDTHFLSYYVTKAPSDKTEYATLTVAEIYGMDGTKKEIIREKYENHISWSSSEGTLIEIFTVENGEIYGFGRRLINNAYSFYIYHYSKTGELSDTRRIPDMEKVLGDEQPLELSLVGDYIVLRTYESLTTYICKQTQNGLAYIAKGTFGKLFYAVSDVDNVPYIFFIESNVNDDATLKEKACPLYSLNTDTGKIQHFKIEIPLENPYSTNFRVLSNGDLLATYCESSYNPQKLKKFILPKEKLGQLLSQN